jgi:hypothetical protein
MVSAVECLRIESVELPHSLRQVAIDSFDDQVKVVRHLAVGMNDETEPLADHARDREPRGAVLIITVNCFAVIAARGHVVECAPSSRRSGRGIKGK